MSLVRDSVREIAIRMALGATQRIVATRILYRGLLLTMAGVTIGTIGARSISKLLSGQLYQIEPADLATFELVPLFVTLISSISVYFSALLATRADPA